MENILTTENLTKRYGNVTVVDHVNMHVRQGDIYGLIGHDSAGKTTLLRMLAGLCRPSEGKITLFGRSGKALRRVISRVGALVGTVGAYQDMTARENLRMKCLAMGIRDTKHPDMLLETVGLETSADKKIRSFTMGMKQRLGVALALAGNPDLVILDEPINELDPQNIAMLRETIERLNHEHFVTFIISSHILEELSKIATNYGMVHNGALMQEMTKKRLLETCGRYVDLQASSTPAACTALESIGISNYKVIDSETIRIFEPTETCGEITAALDKRGVSTISICLSNENLEDYYLRLVEERNNAESH